MNVMSNSEKHLPHSRREKAAPDDGVRESMSSSAESARGSNQDSSDSATPSFRPRTKPVFQAKKATALPSELVNHPRYEILQRIGAGGMGTVYRARHRLMDRLVAVKIIHPHLLD